ncbi:MAG TPA: alpha/beta hydrolase [Mycobacterium sp.]
MAVIFSGRGGMPLAADLEGRWQGPPVVLLHSQGQSRRVWRHTLKRLAAQGFLAIAYDARGCGDSVEAVDEDLSLTAQMSDLRHVIDQLGGHAVVVAHGTSAMVAQYGAAGSRATSTEALVLIDPSPPSAALFRSGLSREEIERAVASVSAPTLVWAKANPPSGGNKPGQARLSRSAIDAMLQFVCAHTKMSTAV